MDKPFRIYLTITLGMMLTLALPLNAAQVFHTRVKVIHGSREPGPQDPRISDIVREVQPVFKYSRFEMIKEKQFTLRRGEQGRVSLPGKRSLIITPGQLKDNRIRYQIQIKAKGNPVFQTGVMLRNGHSVTIGGPRYNNGVLLFNIHGATP